MNTETDPYIDPPNAPELISTFKDLVQKDEIRSFIDNTFPGWLVASTDSYTVDYSYLQKNWESICESNGVKPQKIVIVKQVVFDKKDNVNHSLLMFICEQLTRMGYVIRRQEELTGCEQCFKAMVARDLWSFLRHKKLPVPMTWSSRCSECTQSGTDDIKGTEE